MNYFEGNEFFLFLLVVLIIGFIINYFEKNKEYFIIAVSLFLAGNIYGKSISMLLYLIAFLVFQYCLVIVAQRTTKPWKNVLVGLSIMPLVLNKLFAMTPFHFLAFIGISYMSFKTIQMMLEISDGLIKERVCIKDYLQFLLFFPTVSAGPIDRSSRFLAELKNSMTRQEYL